MSDDLTGKQVTGCLGAVLHLSICIPIWYVLLFHVLSVIQAPPWIWAAYWVYVPTGVIAGILTHASK
ncbi:MAG: hypothetical protein ACYS7Y_33015 [Planctomycetota bacterium]|jgi:hypothetical protein